MKTEDTHFLNGAVVSAYIPPGFPYAGVLVGDGDWAPVTAENLARAQRAADLDERRILLRLVPALEGQVHEDAPVLHWGIEF